MAKQGSTEAVALDAFTHDPHNANLGSVRGAEMIKASLEKYGAGRSIVVDKNNVIIAGNKTIEGATAAGLKGALVVDSDGSRVIVVRRTDLDIETSPKARELAIADNRAAEVSLTWDLEQIDILLQDPNIDMSHFWTKEEMHLLHFPDGTVEMPTPMYTDKDDVPPIPKVASSAPGDLYKMGDHRLLCGDSTSTEDVLRLMSGEQANMVWTDPPYNIAVASRIGTKGVSSAEARGLGRAGIANDDMEDAEFRAFLTKVFENCVSVAELGAAIYVAHADAESYNFRGAMTDAGWSLRQCLIWVKNSLVLGRQDYHWRHEPILYGWKPGAAHNWYSDRSQTTVLEFDRPSRSEEHPTMKPVALVEYCIGNSSAKGDRVLDLFGGSGTTLIACEAISRACRMMELDPVYVDVIVKRWAEATGRKPLRFGAAGEEKPVDFITA